MKHEPIPSLRKRAEYGKRMGDAYLHVAPETLLALIDANAEVLAVVECLFPPDQWDAQMAMLKPGPAGTVVVELLTSRPELEALRAAMLRARGEDPPAKETP